MKILNILNRVIEFSFYAIFFLVPLVLSSKTSELFEFNKMWLVFAATIIIAAAWFSKMAIKKQTSIKRTPLDIPILLFLASQIISTVFSWDTHVSLWGYYSRFNGGLLSIISYIFLYYAFVSNFTKDKVMKSLFVSLLSGFVVTLWGIPSHFGYDATCFLFRGSFDVSCWTEDFQPKIRIFSTLGQPNWLAAYLAILIPISMALGIQKTQNTQGSRLPDFLKIRFSGFPTYRVFRVFWLLLATLFFLALLYTRSQSGFLGIATGLLVFYAFSLLPEYKIKKKAKLLIRTPKFVILAIILLVFLAETFFVGSPIEALNKFTYQSLRQNIIKTQEPAQGSFPSLEYNITSSGDIRKVVWQGALNIWRANPIIGTGVETFAYSYYKYKPVEHNLTSEWNFLYNKAHNEFLNYLATTGILGLGTYLFMIGTFLTIVILRLKAEGSQILRSAQNDKALILGLIAGYISILVTNFFGFSVVITNVYLFIIPAFVLMLSGGGDLQKEFIFPKINNQQSTINNQLNLYQWTAVSALLLVAFYLLLVLFRFWQADRAYALGFSLDKGGGYQQAYFYLADAVQKRGSEPTFADELSINNAVVSLMLASQVNEEDATEAAALSSQFAQNAIAVSDRIVSEHPNNVTFLKTRTRMFYNLAQLNPEYLTSALEAIKKANALAPNDATISYNLGVIYGQSGDTQKAVETLEKTIKLKPDYKDAHFALGLFYRELATDGGIAVTNPEFQKKAEEALNYILENIASDDAQTKDTLESWK